MALRALSIKTAAKPLFGLGVRSTSIGIRHLSTQPPENPKSKAASILNALPGHSALTKTGILATSAAGAIYAISNELYVINEETILVGTFTGVVLLIAKLLAPSYKEYADNRLKKVAEILNASRKKHVDAVKERIETVSQLEDVSATTKVLFDVSKETLELEAKAFELKQKVNVATEAKAVLDSWVRYESSVRQHQQKQIAESVIQKVQAELTNPKFQDKILQQSVADVEKLFVTIK